MRGFDVCIIGNGILGLSAAYFLHKENPELRICIIGPKLRTGSASLAAGAMLSSFGETTQLSFSSKYGLAKMNMAVQSGRLWSEWIKEINSLNEFSEPLAIKKGTFIILNSASCQREETNFAAIIKGLEFYKEPYQEINPAEIPGLNPIEPCRPLKSLFLPNEGFINPFHVLHTLDCFFNKQNNIEVINESLKRVIYNEEAVAGVETHKEKMIKADHIIVAAGSYSQTLLEQIPFLRNKIPMILSGVGVSFILKQAKHEFNAVIRTPNRTGACGMHIMPRQQDTLFIGASNGLGINPKTETRMRDVYYLIKRATEQFNQDFHSSEILNWFVGNRPAPVDSYPLIGKTSLKGLWLLTGTYRDGFHNAPFLGKHLAERILYNTPSLEIFEPERPLIQTMTKEQAIEEFVEQYFGSGYEDGMELPKVGWNILLKEALYKKGVEIYKELEVEIGIPFDVLIMLELKRDLIPFFRNYYQSMKLNKTPLIIKDEQNSFY